MGSFPYFFSLYLIIKMKLSLYTLLFERKGKHYLYNSETEFLSVLQKDDYEKLYDGAFNELDREFFSFLIKKRIIVDDDNLYNYYESSKLRFLSNIGVTDSLDLIIAPTTGCNFACPYCFEGEKKNFLISNEVISGIIAFINNYKLVKTLNITWYGGEPLLAFSKIKNIISRINQECKAEINYQSMITNGYLLSEKTIKQMVELHFNNVQISLDGDENNHNKTRFVKGNKRETFSKIFHNIKSLVDCTPEDFKIDIRINVNKNNQEDFPHLYRKIIEYFGIKKVNPYPGFIRETSNDNCKMCYKSLFNKDRYQFYKKLRREGIPVDFFPHVNNQKGCMANCNYSFVIGPQGEMYKCWNDFNNPERIIGYIHEKNLKNPSLVSRYLYDTSIYNNPECKDCFLFPVCDGGCQWFRYKNIFENKEYNICNFMKDHNILEECLIASSDCFHGKEHKINAI